MSDGPTVVMTDVGLLPVGVILPPYRAAFLNNVIKCSIALYDVSLTLMLTVSYHRIIFHVTVIININFICDVLVLGGGVLCLKPPNLIRHTSSIHIRQ